MSHVVSGSHGPGQRQICGYYSLSAVMLRLSSSATSLQTDSVVAHGEGAMRANCGGRTLC